MVIEIFDASESIDNAVLEPMIEISNMLAKDYIIIEDTKEQLESFNDTEKNEEVELIKDLHTQVHKHINKQNERYKEQTNKHRKRFIFKPGDIEWIHLRKEHFPLNRFGIFVLRVYGSFKVLVRIIDNAYKIVLPSE